MVKRTKEEIDALWKKADAARKNAPKLSVYSEDIQRTIQKWRAERESWTADSIFDFFYKDDLQAFLANDNIMLSNLFDCGFIMGGIRGDTTLWNRLQEHFRDDPLPKSSDILKQMLNDAYEELTGNLITYEEIFYVKSLNTGGMTGGGIMPPYWKEYAFPFLIFLYESVMANEHREKEGR